MTDTASQVPGRFDVIINGHGYCLLDSIDESIPFRTHRAVYGQTQPFVERQNVSNSYGDNAQDFFQQIRQRDWSLGEQQKYFRAGQDGRYWLGQNVYIGIPGQVTLNQQIESLSFAAAVRGTAKMANDESILTASSSNIYRVNSSAAIDDRGAHGLGTYPARWGLVSDGNDIYISGTGGVGVRKYTGAAYSTFSATVADSLAFVNNTLYGFDQAGARLLQYDTAGTATVLYTWKSSAGAAGFVKTARLRAYGGKLLIGFAYGQESSELWVYDGAGVSRLEVLPQNFMLSDLQVLYGVVYIAGSFMRYDGSNYKMRPAVHFYDGSIGKLWQATDYDPAAFALANIEVGPHPALAINDGKLIFLDTTTGHVMAYDPAGGGVSSLATYAVDVGNNITMASTTTNILMTQNATSGFFFPSTTYPASGYVISSLIDFDSSLQKVFRSVTVEFDAASDGNGGTIDVAYQIGSVSGSWTSLASAVSSGTETLFPAGVTGHSIAIKVTLNKGTSTAGPTLRSMSVRGAPIMPVYPRGEYILDCTATAQNPRELRDGSFHPLTGYEMVQNLVTARNSTTPISVTDKVNGTFTAFVDVNDSEGFDVYEVHPATDDPRKAGSYVVRLTVRGV